MSARDRDRGPWSCPLGHPVRVECPLGPLFSILVILAGSVRPIGSFLGFVRVPIRDPHSVPSGSWRLSLRTVHCCKPLRGLSIFPASQEQGRCCRIFRRSPGRTDVTIRTSTRRSANLRTRCQDSVAASVSNLLPYFISVLLLFPVCLRYTRTYTTCLFDPRYLPWTRRVGQVLRRIKRETISSLSSFRAQPQA